MRRTKSSLGIAVGALLILAAGAAPAESDGEHPWDGDTPIIELPAPEIDEHPWDQDDVDVGIASAEYSWDSQGVVADMDAVALVMMATPLPPIYQILLP